METIRIKQFCTIVETQNLRKAAEILGVSHSGLSKSVKVLEEELGFKLLLPNGRGIAITDDGMALYARSRRFFEELKKLVGEEKATPIEVVRVGSFEVFTSQFIAQLLASHLKGVEAEIHELIPGKLEESLHMNHVDIGITYEPIPRPGIEYIKVTSVVMGIFALKGRFKNFQLEKVPFVVPVNPLEGAPSGVRGLDAWPDQKFKRHSPYRVGMLDTGMELVRRGLCAIFIPKFVAQLHNESIHPDLRIEELELPRGMKVVQRDVFIVKRASTVENMHIQQIARALGKLS